MDLVTICVFLISFIICLVMVFLISYYGTAEQRFEDGLLLEASGDKKKERKKDFKKEDLSDKKKATRWGKKLAGEKQDGQPKPKNDKENKVEVKEIKYKATKEEATKDVKQPSVKTQVPKVEKKSQSALGKPTNQAQEEKQAKKNAPKADATKVVEVKLPQDVNTKTKQSKKDKHGAESKTEIKEVIKVVTMDDSKLELKLDSKKASKTNNKNELKLNAKIEPKLKTMDGPKVIEQNANAKNEPKVNAKSDPKVTAKSETKMNATNDTKVTPKKEIKADPKSEPKDKAKNESKEKAKNESKEKAKNEPKEKAKNESKEKAKNESKEKAKSELKEKAKSEPKEKAKNESKEKAKSEPKEKAKSEPKEKAKSEPKEKAKNEPKEKVKNEPKVQEKNEPKVKSESEPKVQATGEPNEDAKGDSKPKAKKKKGNDKSESNNDSKSEAKVDVKSEPKLNAKDSLQKGNPQNEQPTKKAKNESMVNSKCDPKVVKNDPKVNTTNEGKVNTESDPKVKNKNEPKVDAKSEKHKGNDKNESKGDAKSDSKVKAKNEPKVNIKDEAKIDSKSEAKNEPKSVATKEQSKGNAKDEPKIDSKTVQPKPNAKNEPKSESKNELHKPNAKNETKLQGKNDQPKVKAKSESKKNDKAEPEDKAVTKRNAKNSAIVESKVEPSLQSNCKQKSEEKITQTVSDKPNIGMKKEESGRAAPANPKELIAIVKKMPLQEDHIQQLIDILLNKHNNDGKINGFAGLNRDSGWIGGDKNNEKVKILQRLLNDKEAQLNEEISKTKSLAEKLNVLRSELNHAKSGQIQTQKLLDDVQTRSQQKVNQLEGLLKQGMDHSAHEISHWQNKVQFHIEHSRKLQSTLDSLQNEANDKDEKACLESEVSVLKGLLKAKTTEVSELQCELKKFQDETNKWAERCSQLEKKAEHEREHLQEKVDEMGRSKLWMMENQISELKSTLMNFKTKVACLNEENERLSEQLASNVERPCAEGQEANGSSKERSHLLQTSEFMEEATSWKMKYESAKQEFEKLIIDRDVIINELRSTVSSYELKLEQSLAENENQKAKNNFEELKKTLISAERDEQRAYLTTLFPMVKLPPTSSGSHEDHKQWLTKFTNILKEEMSTKKTENEDIEKLDKQVTHYKKILAQTEDILNQLQMHVESEENRWKDIVSELKGELIEKENCFANEKQAFLDRISTLERDSKKNLSSDESSLLHQQIFKLNNDLELEKKAHQTVCDQAAKLNQLVSTVQEALQQEKRTSDKLRLQLTEQKTTSQVTESAKNGSLESTQPEKNVE